ncbi:uridine kinase [Flavobacteriaceae bacterium]|nr:uridine kinase [Flavobacteriaceae bacterium]
MTIIGVAGGTASGKTTFVNEVMSGLSTEDLGLIAQDAYYKDNSHLTFDQRCLLNYDHPEAIDFDLMVEQIKALKAGASIDQPVYDYKIHNRTKETLPIAPKAVFIIEGILVLHHKALRDLMDLKIFVDAPGDQRLMRRMKRDMAERGRDLDEVMQRYSQTLKPMHDAYIEPSKAHADIVVLSHQNNPQAVSLLQTYIESKMSHPE